ncbi:sugar ABC transporter permease [Planctomycetota bacterium]|nr:sugar ABC transporter permease [Planctomycetota bacterium]
MAVKGSKYRQLFTGLAFIGPNIAGVFTFVIFPVLFAILLAFSNWDLTKHNIFKDEPLYFVGLDNFTRLFNEGDFVRFLLNTLFLMMGIPFCVAGSLFCAMMLNKDNRGGGGKIYLYLTASALLFVGCIMLTLVGMGASAMTLLLAGVGGTVLISGLGFGQTIFRTLFYMPHFTTGVATYLLWKKLYDPYDGPINNVLNPVLGYVEAGVKVAPSPIVYMMHLALVVVVPVMFAFVLKRVYRWWQDGDLGSQGAFVTILITCIPIAVLVMKFSGFVHWTGKLEAVAIGGASVVMLLLFAIKWWNGKPFQIVEGMYGFGSALAFSLLMLVLMFIAIGLSMVVGNLPEMAQSGLEAPHWLTDYHWAKPSLMIMGFWAAIGSNNMLLYLAALTNVPKGLYEAAEIDGAGRFQTFWNVTWPQLAPTTFFIAVMSTIGGLQGGFEAARTMTEGGPSGATTTLSYYIYMEGFQTGRLSFSAALAWALFILVFTITLFNWKFGNRYVND